ncbi:MAG: hypothetical protein AAB557_04255 [Patescibacteria group bacterium]
MDISIITAALGTFVTFLIVHVIVLRRISDRAVILTFWMTYGAVGMILYTLLSISAFIMGMNISSVVFAVVVSGTLYTLLVGNYFMGIFGLMESSIRMRVLGEIARAGSQGISQRTLLAQYNHTKIVDKRLARFVASGDIELVRGAYVSRKPFTFFLLPALVLRFVWWAYGRTNIVYVK